MRAREREADVPEDRTHAVNDIVLHRHSIHPYCLRIIYATKTLRIVEKNRESTTFCSRLEIALYPRAYALPGKQQQPNNPPTPSFARDCQGFIRNLCCHRARRRNPELLDFVQMCNLTSPVRSDPTQALFLNEPFPLSPKYPAATSSCEQGPEAWACPHSKKRSGRLKNTNNERCGAIGGTVAEGDNLYILVPSCFFSFVSLFFSFSPPLPAPAPFSSSVEDIHYKRSLFHAKMRWLCTIVYSLVALSCVVFLSPRQLFL